NVKYLRSNFAPVDELKEALQIINIEGKIPDNFPEGVYIRNRRNPLFGGLKMTKSMFGSSSHIWLRFGKVNKYISNTNIFKHSGKFYSIAENHMPQEIDILTLDTLGNWDVNGAWKRPITSHPKDPLCISIQKLLNIHSISLGTEELFNEHGLFPFFEADGKKLVHKVDLKLDRCSICHDIGLTQRYNAIMDFPLTIDIKRLISGGPFKPINSIEGDINSSPEDGLLFSRCYEWRLDMQTGEVRERNLTGTEFSMDFPMINENFTGIKNKYGYTQVVDSIASSTSGFVKFGGLAKLNLEELDTRFSLENTFCRGAALVSKGVRFEEDDGWIITFVHNEDTDISEVHIIDTKNFSSEPVAKINAS
ncbi:carotenoid 9, partial [Quercus suber]